METSDKIIGIPDEALAAHAVLEVAKTGGHELSLAAGSLAMDNTIDLDVTHLKKESFIIQSGAAYEGYQATLNALNTNKHKNKFEIASPETVAQEFEAWFSDDKIEAAKALLEIDPNLKFILVATPNVEVGSKDIYKAAKAFATNQPYASIVYEPLADRYSAKQLSGTDPANGNAVQFSLIPYGLLSEDFEGTVAEQRAKLAELQKHHPALKVPSVLEAISFWQTLEAAGQFDTGFTHGKDNTDYYILFNDTNTYIRHFNLPERLLDGVKRVRGSHLSVANDVVMYSSRVDDESVTRISVG